MMNRSRAYSESENDFSTDSWDAARNVVGAMAPFSYPLRGVVQTLMSTNRSEEEKRYALHVALRLPVYQHTLKQFCARNTPDIRLGDAALTVDDVKKLIGFEASAVFVGLLVACYGLKRKGTARHLRKVWDVISERAELGFFVGSEVAELGSSYGMLLGAFRFVAFGLIGSLYPERFGCYWEHLQGRGVSFDLAYEARGFGFTHPQVMSYALQALGFGPEVSIATFLGLSPISLHPTRDTLAQKFRSFSLWSESISMAKMPAYREPVPGISLTEAEFKDCCRRVVRRMGARREGFWL